MPASSPLDDLPTSARSVTSPRGAPRNSDGVRPALLPLWPLPVLLLAMVAATIHSAFVADLLPDFARYSATGLSILALLISAFVMPRLFSVGLLGSMLPFLIAWRVGATLDAVPIMATASVCAVYYVLLYLDAMAADWARARSWSDRLEWQMTTLRIYFGFDMVGHFVEKLFAGSHSFSTMATQFESFGLPNGALFVIVGGLCELGVAIGVGMGFLTRLAGVGGALYFLIANHFGGHFHNGFTWSNGPDGGWEYPLLMTLFYLSFALSGAGKFSIDGWLIAGNRMPRWARPLCVALPTREPGA